MAVSQIHFRSISLPSRLHPINSTGLEAELEKLKSWQISCLSKTAPITSETIQSGLLRLAELYISVHEIPQSPATQQALLHQDGKSIEDSLESSVDLLDSCNTIRELVQMMKENIQALQSALRRKNLDCGFQNDIASYICLRKKMNKCIAKSIKTLKNLENKNGSNLSLSGDETSINRVLKEVSGITIAIFRCSLVFLSSPTVNSGGWNLVSRLMLNKSVASGKDHNVITEVGCVDLALNNLQRGVRSSDSMALDKQIMQRSLQNLESCIEGIDTGLERLFRQLLQSRVTLLNILTDH